MEIKESNTVKVIHVRDTKRYEDMGYQVEFIGRPSMYGNPYPLGEMSRETVVGLYRGYIARHIEEDTTLWTQICRLACLHERGIKIALACYCAPKACHGDILAQHISGITDEEALR